MLSRLAAGTHSTTSSSPAPPVSRSPDSTAPSSTCESSPDSTKASRSSTPLPRLAYRTNLHSPTFNSGCRKSGLCNRLHRSTHDDDPGTARCPGGLPGLNLLRIEEDLTPVFPPAQHDAVILDLRNRVALYVIADIDSDHIRRLATAPVGSDRQHCRLLVAKCHHAGQRRFRRKLRRCFLCILKFFIRILPALLTEKVPSPDIEKEREGSRPLGETGLLQLDIRSDRLNRFLAFLEVPPASNQILGDYEQDDQHQDIQDN